MLFVDGADGDRRVDRPAYRTGVVLADWFSLKLVELMMLVFDGETAVAAGERRIVGPILDPLELLRLAGIRDRIGDETGVVEVAGLLSVSGFL